MWLWIRNGKGSLAGAGNHPLIARNAQWRIPLGNEDVDARGFPLQPTQRAQLPRGQWLPGAYTALGTAHVPRQCLPIFALVATALPPRDHPTIVSFDPGRYRATVPSWTNPDTSRADADRVVVPSAVVAVVVVIPADPDINALGLGGSGERRSHQHCYSCGRNESDFHHERFLLSVKNKLAS